MLYRAEYLSYWDGKEPAPPGAEHRLAQALLQGYLACFWGCLGHWQREKIAHFILFGTIVAPFLLPFYSSLRSRLCALQLLPDDGTRFPSCSFCSREKADSPWCPSTEICFLADVCCSLPHPHQNAEAPNPELKYRFPSSTLLPFPLTPQNTLGSSRLLPQHGKEPSETLCEGGCDTECQRQKRCGGSREPGPRKSSPSAWPMSARQACSNFGSKFGCLFRTGSPLKFSQTNFFPA